jgi:hypothetical protein
MAGSACRQCGATVRAAPTLYLRLPGCGAARHNDDIDPCLAGALTVLLAVFLCVVLGLEPNMVLIERPVGKLLRIGRVVNMVQLLAITKSPCSALKRARGAFRQH